VLYGLLNNVQNDCPNVQPYELLPCGSEQPSFVNTKKSEPFAFAWFAGLLFEHIASFENYKTTFGDR
jgi:hypothetical protein